MNELYVEDCYLYFKTKENTHEKAFEALTKACEEVGICITFYGGILRDKDGNVLPSGY